jgi:hypothetical protein
MNKVTAVAVLVFGLCAFDGDANAQSRWVFVNGVRMSDAQIAQLEQAACTQIPNGSYWLNMQTGVWGYAGNWQPQGVFGDQCHGGGGGATDRYGPFATLRRAEEEANRYRARGFQVVAFHNGDGYYINVKR